MSLADQLAEATASWRWKKLPSPPGKPFETVGYEAETPKGVARIVRATKNGKPAKDRWVLKLGDQEVDLGKRASFDHGDAALARLLGEVAAPIEPGRTYYAGRPSAFGGDQVSEELLAELAANQIDKDWVAGVRRWWASEAGAAKSYPGRVEKAPFLDGKATMSAGEASRAALDKLAVSLSRLQDDLFVNKGLWQPAGQTISKDDRRWGGTPKVWREKVTTEIEAARDAIWDARTKVDGWIRVVDPETPERFGRGAYPEIFRNEESWNRLVRTFGILVDEAVDSATKAIDRLLRFLSKMSGKSGSEPWEPIGHEVVPDVVSVGRAKLIFDPLPSPSRAARMDPDELVALRDRDRYVREMRKAQALLQKKGFGFLWYGNFHVRPKRSAPANHLGAHLGVAANYPIGTDHVNIYVLDDDLHRYVAHELGHRLWFKFLTPAQRAGFADYFGKVPATTSYGGLNAEEDFAEVFKDYIDGRDLTRNQIERFKAFTQGKWKMESLAETIASALTEMSAKEVRKALKKKGCEELRQKGSHLQIKCGPECQTTIPMHGGDIKKGTLHGIEKSVKQCVGPIR